MYSQFVKSCVTIRGIDNIVYFHKLWRKTIQTAFTTPKKGGGQMHLIYIIRYNRLYTYFIAKT